MTRPRLTATSESASKEQKMHDKLGNALQTMEGTAEYRPEAEGFLQGPDSARPAFHIDFNYQPKTFCAVWVTAVCWAHVMEFAAPGIFALAAFVCVAAFRVVSFLATVEKVL